MPLQPSFPSPGMCLPFVQAKTRLHFPPRQEPYSACITTPYASIALPKTLAVTEVPSTQLHSIQVKHFFHTRPPFAFGAGFKRTLHRSHNFPPLLRFGISRHYRHVCLKICSMVFVIAEQQVIFEEDGIIADIALSDHLQDFWPNHRVMLLIF